MGFSQPAPSVEIRLVGFARIKRVNSAGKCGKLMDEPNQQVNIRQRERDKHNLTQAGISNFGNSTQPESDKRERTSLA